MSNEKRYRILLKQSEDAVRAIKDGGPDEYDVIASLVQALAVALIDEIAHTDSGGDFPALKESPPSDAGRRHQLRRLGGVGETF